MHTIFISNNLILMASSNIIEQYLIEKGLEYKQVNEQFNLKKSPISGESKRNHFYINARSGMRDDKKTGQSGNFNQFREFWGDLPIMLPEQDITVEKKEYMVLPYELVDAYSRRLWDQEPDLIKYLFEERGLTTETIKKFRLGADNGQIVIPIFNEADILTNIRRRKNPKDKNPDMPKYYATSGCRSILFNESILKQNPMEVIITEGELDAMILSQKGMQNVLSVTLGAGYFPPTWADQLKNVKKVFIAYDNDDAGKDGVKKAIEVLGSEKVRVIHIPLPAGEKKCDVTDYFVKYKHTRDDFITLMKEARKQTNLKEDIVKHVSDYNDELRQRLLSGEYKGISTGYEQLDNIVGGYRKGRVFVISGLTSVGKTTRTQNLILNLAHRNIPTLTVSMEMPPIDLCKKFLMLDQRISGKLLEGVKDTDPIMLQVDTGLSTFKGTGEIPGMPLYLMDSTGEIKIQTVTEVCRLAKETYGVEIIAIDHLNYFGQSTQNRTNEVASMMRAIKTIARELDICVLLLCHLNRGGRAGQRRGMYIPTLVDLKESGAVEQDADQVIFVCRDSESSDENERRKTILKVAKNRDGSTGHTSNDFDLDVGYIAEVSGVNYLSEEDLGGLKNTSKRKGKRYVQGDELPF